MFAVLVTAGGALFCCGTPSAAPTADSGAQALDAGRRDASFIDLDGGPAFDAGDGGVTGDQIGCTPEPTWQTVAPFWPEFPMQVAPQAAWAAAMLPEQPCSNGQARCTELAVPPQKGSTMQNRKIYGFAIGPEETSFALRYQGDRNFESCARVLALQPTPNGTRVVGAAQTGGVLSYPGIRTEPPLVLGHPKMEQTGQAAEILVTPWEQYAPRFKISTRVEYPETRTSQNRLYLLDTFQRELEVRDATTGALLSAAHVPEEFNTIRMQFAVGGDLWIEVTRAGTGVELWRVDDKAAFTPMLQKGRTSLLGSWTDGQTLFWVEHTNRTLPASWERVELWSTPFGKDPVALRQNARRVVDLTATGQAYQSVAHAGYYALVTGEQEVLVVRARDGALQRIPIEAPWAASDVPYVDESSVWVNRPYGPGDPGDPGGIMRIGLAPWP
jgi:hypothetical protein